MQINGGGRRSTVAARSCRKSDEPSPSIYRFTTAAATDNARFLAAAAAAIDAAKCSLGERARERQLGEATHRRLSTVTCLPTPVHSNAICISSLPLWAQLGGSSIRGCSVPVRGCCSCSHSQSEHLLHLQQVMVVVVVLFCGRSAAAAAAYLQCTFSLLFSVLCSLLFADCGANPDRSSSPSLSCALNEK